MRRTLGFVFIIFTFLAIAGITAWTVYRLALVRIANESGIESDFLTLKTVLLTQASWQKGLETADISDPVKRLAISNLRLRSVIIYSNYHGILYAFDTKYVSSPLKDDADWKGRPRYSYNRITEVLVHSQFPVPVAENLSLDAVYTVLTPDDLHTPLLHAFIALLGLLLLLGIFLVLRPLIPEGRPRSKEDYSTTEEPKIPETAQETASKRGLFSERTGLGWPEFLPERLGYELDRASANDSDLAFIILSYSGLDPDHERSFTESLSKFVAFPDLSFEHGENCAALIIPNAGNEEGIQKLDSFMKKAKESQADEPKFRIQAGLSSRNGRLISAERLIKEAEVALKKAKAESGDGLVAFKPDPAKYRKFVSEEALSKL